MACGHAVMVTEPLSISDKSECSVTIEVCLPTDVEVDDQGDGAVETVRAC